MKAFRLILFLLCALLCLSGCAAPHAQIALQTPMPTIAPTPEPVVTPAPLQQRGNDTLAAPVTYSAYALPLSLRSGASFSTALYKMVLDAAAAGESQVSLDGLSVSAEQVDAVRGFILGRHQCAYLSDISVDGEALVLNYSSQDQAAIAQAAEAFDKAAKSVLDECCRSGYTVLQCAMALYQYLGQHVEYNYESMDEGVYGALVNKSALANGYAQAYAFLLDQLGVENVLAVSADRSHTWNIITIDGVSYHVDITFGANLFQGQSMRFFGMNDSAVSEQNGYTDWTCTSGVDEAETPVCESDRFAVLQVAEISDVDYKGNAVYYDGGERDTGLYRLDLETGESAAATQDAINGLAVLDGIVYFIRSEDSCLYTYEAQTGETVQILEGTRVVSMERRGGVIYYMPEGETEAGEISP